MLSANPADVASIDAIVTAAYDSISGPPGKRDWNRERSLFIPGARLIPTAKNAEEVSPGGEIAPHMLDVDGFIARVCDYVEKNGFYEKVITRRTEEFGHIAHVWSMYESRQNADDPERFMRGINPESIRGWIVTIYWQHESSAHPVPEKYF